MNPDPVSMATHTARLTLKVEPEFRRRVVKAAETRDGGNVSRLIRRAIEEVIERDQLLITNPASDERGAA